MHTAVYSFLTGFHSSYGLVSTRCLYMKCLTIQTTERWDQSPVPVHTFVSLFTHAEILQKDVLPFPAFLVVVISIAQKARS